METFLDAHHPKIMYHATKPSVQVFSRKQIEALVPEWSETHIYQEYPKCKYHWNGKSVIVKGSEEERALGGGWADSPLFEAYKDPAKVRPKNPAPVKWVDQWPPFKSPEQEKRIQAEVLKAHAIFWKLPDYPSATARSMRQAFDRVAGVLFESGLLTESWLHDDLPGLVWDSAVAGGWWHLASETPQDHFPEKRGHYWVWLDESYDWLNLFRAEIAEWTAKLLESAGAELTGTGAAPVLPLATPATGQIGPVTTPSITKDKFVELLDRILQARCLTQETWARDQRIARTTLCDWKARRLAGKSLKGKVSAGKSAQIESAIREDAERLGFLGSDSNSD